jgi:hypothetical protein
MIVVIWLSVFSSPFIVVVVVIHSDWYDHTSHYGSQLRQQWKENWKLIVRWQQSYQSLWITTTCTTTMKGELKVVIHSDWYDCCHLTISFQSPFTFFVAEPPWNKSILQSVIYAIDIAVMLPVLSLHVFNLKVLEGNLYFFKLEHFNYGFYNIWN